MKSDRLADLFGHIMARPELAFEVDPLALPDKFRPVHAAIVELQATTRDVTPTAVSDECGKDFTRWLTECGLGYHGSFEGALASVAEQSRRTRAMEVAARLRSQAEEGDIEAAIAEAITALAPHERAGLQPIGEIRTARLATLTTATFCVRIEGAEEVPLASSDFVVIGARPGVGKTVLGLQSAVRWAKQGTHTALFSLEMGGSQLFDRIAAGRVPLTVGMLRKGVGSDIRDAIAHETRDLEDTPLFIDDSSPSFASILLSCRAFAARGGRVAVIDYFQLATESQEWQEMASSSNALKRLARQTGLTVIVLSQLSRDVAKESRRPTIADLRGTGSLEQDADTVAVMGKPDDEMLGKWREQGWLLPDEGITFLDFAKSRHSAPACVPLHFNGDRQRFDAIDQEAVLCRLP